MDLILCSIAILCQTLNSFYIYLHATCARLQKSIIKLTIDNYCQRSQAIALIRIMPNAKLANESFQNNFINRIHMIEWIGLKDSKLVSSHNCDKLIIMLDLLMAFMAVT